MGFRGGHSQISKEAKFISHKIQYFVNFCLPLANWSSGTNFAIFTTFRWTRIWSTLIWGNWGLFQFKWVNCQNNVVVPFLGL